MTPSSAGAQVHSTHIECILHGTESFPVGKQAWLVLLVTVGVEGDTPKILQDRIVQPDGYLRLSRLRLTMAPRFARE
jgi:hypothetical protein